jgi:hypothetical protein
VSGARASGLALVAAALLVASACTGTFQPALPLALLVVEGGAPGTPSRVLGYAVDPPGPATPRIVRPLGAETLTPGITGPVVALDWLDRDETGVAAGGGRNQVVFLVSNRVPAETGRSASIHGYDTSTFDLEAPSALEGVPVLTRPLVAAGEFLLPPRAGVQAPLPGVCLDAISVSQTGRFVALLDRRVACDPGAPRTENVLLLVDTVEGDLAWSTTEAPVRSAPPLIDQAAGRLDFLTGNAMVSLSLADASVVATSQPLPIGALDAVQAFGRHGPDRLVVVNDRLYRIDPAGTVNEGVATQGGAVAFVETGTGLPVVLRTASRLVVHDGPTDGDEESFARAYRGGATDVADQLTYLVRPQAIDTFDLLLYDAAVTNPVQAVITPYPAPELADPRAITWFRPRPTAP